MTDKEKYVNVAELKKKVRYWAKTRGMSNLALKAFFDMINNLPVTVKCDLETTLEEKADNEMNNEEIKETELKPLDADVRGYTNMFECQMCLAEIYSEICLKKSDYEYCPYCGRKIKD